ncbi:unnamed protein product, partial [Oppiella nova]
MSSSYVISSLWMGIRRMSSPNDTLIMSLPVRSRCENSPSFTAVKLAVELLEAIGGAGDSRGGCEHWEGMVAPNSRVSESVTTVGRVIKVCIQRIFAIKTMETSPKRIKLDATAIGEPMPSASGGVGDNEGNKWRSLLDRRFDEKDVGISEFIGHFKPFTAVLKNRYEDFLVHEISRDGRVVRLLDTSRPVEDVIPVLDIHEVLDDSTVEQIRQLAKPCD